MAAQEDLDHYSPAGLVYTVPLAAERSLTNPEDRRLCCLRYNHDSHAFRPAHDVDSSAVWDRIGSKQPYPTGGNRTISDSGRNPTWASFLVSNGSPLARADRDG